jgi:hypothetical protein
MDMFTKTIAAWGFIKAAWDAVYDNMSVATATVLFQWFASVSWEAAVASGRVSRDQLSSFQDRISASMRGEGDVMAIQNLVGIVTDVQKAWAKDRFAEKN